MKFPTTTPATKVLATTALAATLALSATSASANGTFTDVSGDVERVSTAPTNKPIESIDLTRVVTATVTTTDSTFVTVRYHVADVFSKKSPEKQRFTLQIVALDGGDRITASLTSTNRDAKSTYTSATGTCTGANVVKSTKNVLIQRLAASCLPQPAPGERPYDYYMKAKITYTNAKGKLAAADTTFEYGPRTF